MESRSKKALLPVSGDRSSTAEAIGLTELNDQYCVIALETSDTVRVALTRKAECLVEMQRESTSQQVTLLGVRLFSQKVEADLFISLFERRHAVDRCGFDWYHASESVLHEIRGSFRPIRDNLYVRDLGGLVAPREAAQRLGISVARLRRLGLTNGVEPFRVGGQVRYFNADLIKLAKKIRESSTSE